MLIPDALRDCVVFIEYNSKQHKRLKLAGTAFLVQTNNAPPYNRYAITAWHVVKKAEGDSTDGKIFLRFNRTNDGPAQLETTYLGWSNHPTDESVDVTVFALKNIPSNFDQKFLLSSEFALGDMRKKARIGAGEEIYLIGLFARHGGTKRNIPIVRTGNIAAVPEEPVQTKMGKMEAYLIEARSIGGLSGSPVFALTEERSALSTNSSTMLPAMVPAENGGLFPNTIVWPGSSILRSFCLLGLMHGHFDLQQSTEDVVVDDVEGGSVNMGIGVVVPATKITEVLAHAENRVRLDVPSER
jgi:hypothetical protein